MSKISELSDGGSLQSTDYLIAVRSGGNVKVQPGSMSVDINGGTIDGVTIGGSSAGAITGTTGQFNTSLNVDGTVTGAITGTTGQFNTSLNVDGTVTADGLTVEGTEANPVNFLRATSSSEKLELSVDDGNVVFDSYQDEAGRYGGFVFQGTENGVGTRKRFEIAYTTGDVLFYEDTGTTAKMVWDASAESLGIGAIPATPLEVQTSTDNSAYIRVGTSSNGGHTIGDDLAALEFYGGDASGSGAGVKGSIRYQYGSTSGATTHMAFAVADVAGSNDVERMRYCARGW